MFEVKNGGKSQAAGSQKDGPPGPAGDPSSSHLNGGGSGSDSSDPRAHAMRVTPLSDSDYHSDSDGDSDSSSDEERRRQEAPDLQHAHATPALPHLHTRSLTVATPP